VVESGLERQLVRIVVSTGLPVLLLQRRYELPGVGVARVDFEFAGLPIVVEVGGSRGYLSGAERQRQERRRNELRLSAQIAPGATLPDDLRSQCQMGRSPVARLVLPSLV
jgi:hypothetical protein